MSAELGAIADELGNKHEARRNLARVARYGPEVLGTDHPYVRTAQRYLGADAPLPAAVPRQWRPVEPGVYRSTEPPPAPDAAPPRGRAALDPAPQQPAPESAAADARWRPTQLRAHWRQNRAPRPPAPAAAWPLPATPAPEPFPAPPPADPFAAARAAGRRAGRAPAQRPADPAPRPSRAPRRAGPSRSGTRPPTESFAAGTTPGHAVSAGGSRRRGDRGAGGGSRWSPCVAFSPGRSGQRTRGTPSASPPAPTAPRDVQLRDDGVAVTLTWTDPSTGSVPFLVAGGRAGEELARLPDAAGRADRLHGERSQSDPRLLLHGGRHLQHRHTWRLRIRSAPTGGTSRRPVRAGSARYPQAHATGSQGADRPI